MQQKAEVGQAYLLSTGCVSIAPGCMDIINTGLYL